MSLSRMALRFAAIEAIKNDPVLSPLHGGRVYDSRMGDFSVTEPAPVIVVYTDDDQGGAFHANNGGPPFETGCDLCIEVGARMVTGTGEDLTLITPPTDRRLELLLDMIESRIVWLMGIGDSDWSQAVRDTTRRMSAIKSTRYRDEEMGERLALREIVLTAQLQPEDYEPATDGGAYADMPDPLRTVCRMAPEGSDFKAVCDLVEAGLAPGVFDRTPMDGVDFTFVPADPDMLGDLTPAEFEQNVEAGEYGPDGTDTQFGATADTDPDD